MMNRGSSLECQFLLRRDVFLDLLAVAEISRIREEPVNHFATWIRSFSFSAHTASSTSLSGIKWNGSFTVSGRV